MRVQEFIGAALVAVLASVPASAADLPYRKGPVLADPAPAYSWDGVYGGLNGGYTWGTTASSLAVFSPSLAAVPPILPAIDAAGSRWFRQSGGTFGGQIGYNWQTNGLLLLGVEADAGWSGLRGTVSSFGTIPVLGGGFELGQSVRTEWQASLRGRVGFTAFERALVYATGGVAFAGVRYTTNFWDTFAEVENASTRSTRVGWTVGGGVEYAVTPNWSVKLEYLRAEYPATRLIGYTPLVDGTVAVAYHSSGTLATDTLRAGVNYRFNWAPPVVAARY